MYWLSTPNDTLYIVLTYPISHQIMKWSVMRNFSVTEGLFVIRKPLNAIEFSFIKSYLEYTLKNRQTATIIGCPEFNHLDVSLLTSSTIWRSIKLKDNNNFSCWCSESLQFWNIFSNKSSIISPVSLLISSLLIRQRLV